MIGAAQLAQMKPTAYLINTARGGLIDTRRPGRRADAGQLAGAALDVQDPEPPDLSQPPYNDPRVIVTPHAAFVSEESLANLRAARGAAGGDAARRAACRKTWSMGRCNAEFCITSATGRRF